MATPDEIKGLCDDLTDYIAAADLNVILCAILEHVVQEVGEVDSTDSPYTVDTTKGVVAVDTTAGDVTVVLPPVALGACITVKKNDTSQNTVTVDGDGSETIDGELTVVLTGASRPSITLAGLTGGWVIL